MRLPRPAPAYVNRLQHPNRVIPHCLLAPGDAELTPLMKGKLSFRWDLCAFSNSRVKRGGADLSNKGIGPINGKFQEHQGQACEPLSWGANTVLFLPPALGLPPIACLW